MTAVEMNESNLPAPPYVAVVAEESEYDETYAKPPDNGFQELTIEDRLQRLHTRAKHLDEREAALQRRENHPNLLKHSAETHGCGLLASAGIWLILFALACTFFACNLDTKRATIRKDPLAHAALTVFSLAAFSIFRFLARRKVEEFFKQLHPDSKMFKATVYAWHVAVPLAVIPSVVVGVVIWIGLIENRWN